MLHALLSLREGSSQRHSLPAMSREARRDPLGLTLNWNTNCWRKTNSSVFNIPDSMLEFFVPEFDFCNFYSKPTTSSLCLIHWQTSANDHTASLVSGGEGFYWDAALCNDWWFCYYQDLYRKVTARLCALTCCKENVVTCTHTSAVRHIL